MTLPSIWAILASSIRQPTAIAAYASVGMHAMLGVALPSLPFFADGPLLSGDVGSPRNQVGMVELSAQDFSRLPLAVTMPASVSAGLPDIAVRSPQYPIPDLNQLPNSPLRSNPSSRPLPGPQQSPQNPGSAATIPYQYPIQPAPNNSGAGDRPNALPPRPSKTILQPPSRLSSAPNPGNPARPNSNRPQSPFDIANAGDDFRLQEYENPGDLLPRPRQSGIAAVFNQPNRSRPEKTAEGSGAATAPTPPAADPADPSEGAIAAQPSTPENPVLRDIEARRDSLSRNPINTTDAEADENNARWLASVTAQPRALTVAGIYPDDACLRRLSGTSIYGVEVQPGGTVTNVELIRSAGHQIFNAQARSQVTSLSFPEVNRPTPFKITVPFTYDRDQCPTLAVPARPEPSPTPAETPAAEETPPETEAAVDSDSSPDPAASPDPDPAD
ncbi:energy transducer TonB [Spirulina major]|uniref:energy transducer TonB n=1 Tax=Spirulina major TaxID=270636 RepID=UPI00093322E5|nr:energy transducer TonB [Spirulina major]